MSGLTAPTPSRATEAYCHRCGADTPHEVTGRKREQHPDLGMVKIERVHCLAPECVARRGER